MMDAECRMKAPPRHSRLHSSFIIHHSSFAFTLIEMLTTVAVLVIVLGLMVSLARDVRNRSAERLTKDLLRRLDYLVAQYKQRSLKSIPEEQRKIYPVVHPLLGETPIEMGDETKQRENAFANN